MIYRASFISSKATLQVVNTLHVLTGSTLAPQSGDYLPTELADDLYTALGTAYRAHLPDGYTWEKISVTTITDPNEPAQVPTVGEHQVGLLGNRALADTDLPPTLCGHVTWLTGLAGRSFRGRMFMPPIETKGAISADLIGDLVPYSTTLRTFAALVQTGNDAPGGAYPARWAGQDSEFVVYSPTRHKQAADPAAAPIIAWRYTREISSLRSRRK